MFPGSAPGRLFPPGAESVYRNAAFSVPWRPRPVLLEATLTLQNDLSGTRGVRPGPDFMQLYGRSATLIFP